MSIASDIGTAVQSAIQGIGLEISTGVDLPDTRVLVRKRPELAQKEEPPLVMVCVSDEQPVEWLNVRQKLRTYTVTVVIATAGGATLQDDTRVRTWRASIEAAVYDDQRACFASVAGFNQCDARPKPPFDPAGLSKDIIWSLQAFDVEVLESL